MVGRVRMERDWVQRRLWMVWIQRAKRDKRLQRIFRKLGVWSIRVLGLQQPERLVRDQRGFRMVWKRGVGRLWVLGDIGLVRRQRQVWMEFRVCMVCNIRRKWVLRRQRGKRVLVRKDGLPGMQGIPAKRHGSLDVQQRSMAGLERLLRGGV